MIVWSGYGILVPVFFALDLVVFSIINQISFLKIEGRFSNLYLFVLVILTGIGIWHLAKHFDKESSKVMIDPKTNQEVILKKSHTFFYISMKAWGVLFILADVVWFILNIAGCKAVS